MVGRAIARCYLVHWIAVFRRTRLTLGAEWRAVGILDLRG